MQYSEHSSFIRPFSTCQSLHSGEALWKGRFPGKFEGSGDEWGQVILRQGHPGNEFVNWSHSPHHQTSPGFSSRCRMGSHRDRDLSDQLPEGSSPSFGGMVRISSPCPLNVLLKLEEEPFHRSSALARHQSLSRLGSGRAPRPGSVPKRSIQGWVNAISGSERSLA